MFWSKKKRLGMMESPPPCPEYLHETKSLTIKELHEQGKPIDEWAKKHKKNYPFNKWF